MGKHSKASTRFADAICKRFDLEYERGVRAAADVAAQYNGSTTHDYRLDDCILAKLNLATRAPRKNKVRIQGADQAFIAGMGLALAEMYRQGSDGADERIVARDAGLTLDSLRKAGVDPYDLKALKKAGIK